MVRRTTGKPRVVGSRAEQRKMSKTQSPRLEETQGNLTAKLRMGFDDELKI